MKIGDKTIHKAIDMANRLYLSKTLDMVIAALRSDEGLTVNLTMKFTPSKKKSTVVDIDASIAFIKEKVKESSSGSVDENQEGLFDDEATSSVEKVQYHLDRDKTLESPDDDRWCREVKFIPFKGDPDELFEEGWQAVCKKCVEGGESEEVYITVPGIGRCDVCGVKDVRLYIEGTLKGQEKDDDLPL